MTAPADLAALDRGKYLRLTTFKRDGTAVPTPVWFVVDGSALLVWTDADSGKAKRIRNDGRVEVAPSDGRGKPTGAARTGQARQVDDEGTHRRAHDLLNRKYGLTKKAFEVGIEATRIARRRPKGTEAILEITLDP
jgi:PPOX class probable F420-dependent enzyme